MNNFILNFFSPGEPIACSHSRAQKYYLHSILNRELFPSRQCKSVSKCKNEVVDDRSGAVYMGEPAMETFHGYGLGNVKFSLTVITFPRESKLFYSEVKDCHWNYEEHNNHQLVNICVGRLTTPPNEAPVSP